MCVRYKKRPHSAKIESSLTYAEEFQIQKL